MALEKVITYDYDVRTEFKYISERQRTAIVEDGKELSFSYIRRMFVPTQDVSSERDELKALSASVWTDAVKEAYADKIAADAER
tara:strand:+ start:378 stop:629 length:252 start_codon:yes stop_codon:yes gene_type:complete